MKKFFLPLALALTISSQHAFSQTKALFNGKDLKGWHIDVPEMDKDPKAINPFLVRNERDRLAAIPLAPKQTLLWPSRGRCLGV